MQNYLFAITGYRHYKSVAFTLNHQNIFLMDCPFHMDNITQNKTFL